jgi:hypothetical protein
MAFANFDLMAICENDLMAICENDLKPKNFSAYGHMALYTIYKGHPGTVAGAYGHGLCEF